MFTLKFVLKIFIYSGIWNLVGFFFNGNWYPLVLGKAKLKE